LFTKPFDGQLDRDDVLTLLGWPESGQVEFKQDIPERNGKQDPWHEGKDFATCASHYGVDANVDA
jgi:hypothetical protein